MLRGYTADGRVVVRFSPRAGRETRQARDRRLLAVMIQEQFGRCHYCNVSFNMFSATSALRPTIDEKVPRSLGGVRTRSNCVAACDGCNRRKGSMNYEMFMQIRHSPSLRAVHRKRAEVYVRGLRESGVKKRDPFSYQVTGVAGDGYGRTVARGTCHKCGATDDVTITGNNNPELVRKKFEERGWKFDEWKPGECICPRCQVKPAHSTDAELIRFQERMKGADMTTMKPAAAPAVRVATVEEKAKIRRELDSHFDEGKGCYLDGYTDQKVGTTLGIPWALVAQVREAAYGPIRSDPELEAIRGEIETVKAGIDAERKRSADGLAALERQLAELVARAARLDQTRRSAA